MPSSPVPWRRHGTGAVSGHGFWRWSPDGRAEVPGQAQEGPGDPSDGSQAAGEIAGDLRVAAAPAPVVNGQLQDAKPRLRCAHLLLEVPAIGFLGHAEALQRVAADGAKGTHIAVAHAIEQAQEMARDPAGRELRRVHAARLAPAADPRADDEILLAFKN